MLIVEFPISTKYEVDAVFESMLNAHSGLFLLLHWPELKLHYKKSDNLGLSMKCFPLIEYQYHQNVISTSYCQLIL